MDIKKQTDQNIINQILYKFTKSHSVIFSNTFLMINNVKYQNTYIYNYMNMCIRR